MDERLDAFTVKIDTGTADEHALLLFIDGALVACLVRLDDKCHGMWRRHWSIESAYGFAVQGLPHAFGSLDAAVAAVTHRACGAELSLRAPPAPLLQAGPAAR
ncbi:hypothetical protein [Sphingopyxis terrae]|uniref:Uncharacterized protein n=1 Tax=Sphingopyxis terrae subsp. ummariensis TaxID=429001 RepID=A0A1Y6FNG0_9SPHN|nr:hypothetical protein [Sphingopyxis terrae]PCF91334.1 hypothetical protein CPA46_07705 [Sphingopyxis terrae subsp. ummariensis]SMQ76508.1 hypothetical protein SAMN06295984_1949 [Sphingopyxis terrae subsp. ummariensis]